MTRGFADQLRIGYQNRPNIFARRIELPELLYESVVEIDERLTAEGDVLTPLDADGARASLQTAYDDGIRSIAICFMHGYRYHDHEADVAAIAREIGFTQVSATRSQPADEICRSWRHDRCRRLCVAHPASLRRSDRTRWAMHG